MGTVILISITEYENTKTAGMISLIFLDILLILKMYLSFNINSSYIGLVMF